MKLFKCLLILFAMTFNIAHADDQQVAMAMNLDWIDSNLSTLKWLFSRDAGNAQKFALLTDPVDPILNQPSIIPPTVCEYQLVDMHNDGTVQMVMTVSYNGGSCADVYILTQQGATNAHTYKQEIISGDHHIEPLANIIVNLSKKADGSKDGKMQLLIPRQLVTWQQIDANPSDALQDGIFFVRNAMMTDVYAWNGTKYAPANTSFKSYYQNTLLPNVYADRDKKQQWAAPAHLNERRLWLATFDKQIAAYRAILSQK